MRRTIWSVVVAVSAMTIGVAPAHAAPVQSDTPAASHAPKVDRQVRERAAGGHKVRVNVVTRTRADLPKAAKAGHVVRTLHRLPVVTMRVDEADLDELAAQPGVASVTEDRPEPPTLAESVPLIGGDKTRSAGLTGDGSVVAVLDTGVATHHPFLAGRVVGEACFSVSDPDYEAGSLCPDGSDEQQGVGSADAESGPCAHLDCGHGTHVAGIAAGNGQNTAGAPPAGVAPGASILAVQVFSEIGSEDYCGEGAAPCVLSFPSAQLSALEDVLDKRQSGMPVIAANMSLGSGQYTAACDNDLRKPAIDALLAAGVATVVSAGNSAYASAVSAPACVSSAIAVGSTTKQDDLSYFSNRGAQVDLFAPGSDIVSSVPGNGWATMSGTSMAAPHVTGAFAVLRQAYPDKSVTELAALLKSTGKPLTVSGVTTPRIQLDAATAAVTPKPAAGENQWKLAADGADTAGTNPFTALGGATFGSSDAPYSLSGAATFNGNTAFLKSKSSAVKTDGDYTVSAWVKINSATVATAVCQGTSEHQAFYLGYDPVNKGWMFQTTTTNDDNTDWPTAEGGTNSGPVGTWAHLVATYSASTGAMAIYQNGTLQGKAVNHTPQYDAGLPLTVGGCVNSANENPYYNFPGKVADVHVYPYAMNDTQAGKASVTVPAGWSSGMPEDQWKLATTGDDTAGLNPLTVHGGATFSTDKPTGTSLTGSVSFNGSTGLLKGKQAAVNTFGDYSVSAWVKINSAVQGTAICQGTTEHQAFYIGYDPGNKGWMFQTTTSNDDNTDWVTAEGDANSGPAGAWAHVVATYNASTGAMAIYQNGVLQGRATNLTPQYDSGLPLTVGGCVNSATATTPYQAFPGNVADVHVFPRTLTATEVSALG
ncbi:S8 family serine peptidase [Streptomyces sp. NBC_01320]|uniref:S8 family serine peptidase n=1 Tax=Streptomyces sp. NBC_01320 TaxID=2903824 RepID=UPI002E0E71F7|nr:S8 family serine peptidase [Streptomyces sp. NBC_01320]